MINNQAAQYDSRWIMIVEDNPDDEQLARRVISLSNRTESVRFARAGDEALELLRQPEIPVLVLLDLKLPRLSGVEVLMAIKDDLRLKVVPVVVLTSSDEKTDRSACYELGCNAFVRKPVDYDEYRSEVRTLLEFWLDINLTA